LVILGSGEHQYRLVDHWGALPDGWSFGKAAAVAVDRKDNVYVFSRTEHPVLVFNPQGEFVKSWGEGIFQRAHGLHLGPDDCLYCTDDLDHTVRKCTLDGKVLLTIGNPGRAAPYMSGEPFHRCTHTALSPSGEIYVSDGYGNARIHKYTPDGRKLLSWGEPGVEPGQFSVPHNICCDEDGWVYVADRESHRVQVFDGNGRFETQWTNVHRPCALFMPPGRCPFCYVGEMGPASSMVNAASPNLGPRISIMNKQGKRLATLGETNPETHPKLFLAPHGIATNSRGDIFLADPGATSWQEYNPRFPCPPKVNTLHKMEKIS